MAQEIKLKDKTYKFTVDYNKGETYLKAIDSDFECVVKGINKLTIEKNVLKMRQMADFIKGLWCGNEMLQ